MKHCHIKEPICYGRNLACYALRKPLEVLLSAAEGFFSFLSGALRLAAGVLRAVQFAFESAHTILNLAGKALESGKQLLHGAIKIFEAVVDFGLTNLLTINHVSLEASLATASQSRFAAAVDMTVLGASIDWRGELYLPNPANLIADIMKRIGGGFVGKKKRATTKVNKVMRLVNYYVIMLTIQMRTFATYISLQL